VIYSLRTAGLITHVVPQSGRTSGETTVTISGTNLGALDIISVMFGTKEAIIKSQTATSVIVLTPAASTGQITVEVQSVSFGSTSLLNAFSYISGIGSVLI